MLVRPRAGPEFGLEALRGLNKILSSNDLILAGHDVFFDQGLVPNKLAFEECAEALDLCGCFSEYRAEFNSGVRVASG